MNTQRSCLEQASPANEESTFWEQSDSEEGSPLLGSPWGKY